VPQLPSELARGYPGCRPVEGHLRRTSRCGRPGIQEALEPGPLPHDGRDPELVEGSGGESARETPKDGSPVLIAWIVSPAVEIPALPGGG